MPRLGKDQDPGSIVSEYIHIENFVGDVISHYDVSDHQNILILKISLMMLLVITMFQTMSRSRCYNRCSSCWNEAFSNQSVRIRV